MLTSQRLLKQYGTTAELYIPITMDYNPDSGDNESTWKIINIQFLEVPIQSNDPDFGLDHFSSATVWFMPINKMDIDFIDGLDISTKCYISKANRTWDIQGINRYLVKDSIVAFEALVK